MVSVFLMASHPAATSKTYEYLETVINGAAPIATSDVDRFLAKVQVLALTIYT